MQMNRKIRKPFQKLDDLVESTRCFELKEDKRTKLLDACFAETNISQREYLSILDFLLYQYEDEHTDPLISYKIIRDNILPNITFTNEQINRLVEMHGYWGSIIRERYNKSLFQEIIDKGYPLTLSNIISIINEYNYQNIINRFDPLDSFDQFMNMIIASPLDDKSLNKVVSNFDIIAYFFSSNIKLKQFIDWINSYNIKGTRLQNQIISYS